MLPAAIGRYRIIRPLGEGGMGRLYLAELTGRRGFARRVVVKMVADRGDEQLERLLFEEARLMSLMAHRNIVAVLDLEECDGRQLMILEFIEGVNLRLALEQAMARGAPIGWPLGAYVASEVAAALDYAHRRTDPAGRPLKVVHRDVSTRNILLSWEGEVKLTDFGIARAAHRWSTGGLKGNVAYMAPEQALGDPIDGRADIYALGIVLYEMMCGTNPFGGRNDLATLALATEAAIPPLPQGLVPPALAAIIARSTAQSASARFQTASELRAALLALPDLPRDPQRELAAFLSALRPRTAFAATALDLSHRRGGAATARRPPGRHRRGQWGPWVSTMLTSLSAARVVATAVVIVLIGVLLRWFRG